MRIQISRHHNLSWCSGMKSFVYKVLSIAVFAVILTGCVMPLISSELQSNDASVRLKAVHSVSSISTEVPSNVRRLNGKDALFAILRGESILDATQTITYSDDVVEEAVLLLSREMPNTKALFEAYLNQQGGLSEIAKAKIYSVLKKKEIFECNLFGIDELANRVYCHDEDYIMWAFRSYVEFPFRGKKLKFLTDGGVDRLFSNLKKEEYLVEVATHAGSSKPMFCTCIKKLDSIVLSEKTVQKILTEGLDRIAIGHRFELTDLFNRCRARVVKSNDDGDKKALDRLIQKAITKIHNLDAANMTGLSLFLGPNLNVKREQPYRCKDLEIGMSMDSVRAIGILRDTSGISVEYEEGKTDKFVKKLSIDPACFTYSNVSYEDFVNRFCVEEKLKNPKAEQLEGEEYMVTTPTDVFFFYRTAGKCSRIDVSVNEEKNKREMQQFRKNMAESLKNLGTILHHSHERQTADATTISVSGGGNVTESGDGNVTVQQSKSKCSYCGSERYGSCSRSPSGEHEHRSDMMHCIYCGSERYGSCSLSPSGEHRHGNGGGKCVWCGSERYGSCSRSPSGEHEH